MRFAIVGGGLREHALARRLVQEGNTVTAVLTQANPGLADLADRVVRVHGDPQAIVSACSEADSDCVVVQAEVLLDVGLSDRLARIGTPTYGASAAMARLEG